VGGHLFHFIQGNQVLIATSEARVHLFFTSTFSNILLENLNEAELQRQTKDLVVNKKAIEKLFSLGLLSNEAMTEALSMIQPRSSWVVWISHSLLFIGSALILSGIIYFFAFNWAGIGRLEKIALVQCVMLACFAMSFYKGLVQLSGKVLNLAGCVLVGVFLAVFGQIYQTGADAYQLFMGWAGLIAGFVLITKFEALWMLWLVILNFFFVLYFTQEARMNRSGMLYIFILLATFNGSFLLLKEVFSKRFEWLRARWSRFVILTFVLALLIWMQGMLVWGTHHQMSTWLGGGGSFLAQVIIYYIYRYKVKDMAAFSLNLLGFCIVLECLAINLIVSSVKGIDIAAMFFMGLVTLGVFSGAAAHIKYQLAKMQDEI
jgi:uncharacterized membrane protein